MNQIEILKIVNEQWSLTKSDDRIKVLQATRKLVPDELLEFFDALLDSKLSNIQDDVESTVVILIHGIQTDAAWQKLVQSEFRVIQKTNVSCIGYEFYNAAQLFSPFRNRPIEKVKREIRDIKSLSPNARLVVVAHSFGTYIASRILCGSADIRFNRIILCGSIVRRDFRWDIYSPGLNSESIINDAGTSDIWPIVATAVSFGYGSSGRMGFQTNRVHDRYFPYKHSEFFTEEHIRKFWIPFVKEGKIVQSDWDANRPKNGLFMGFLSNVWQAKLLMLIFALAIYKIILYV